MIDMRFISLTLVLASVSFNGYAVANTCDNAVAQPSASEVIEKQMRAFRQTDFGAAIASRAESGSLVSLRSEAISVDRNVSHPDFAKSRDFAYAKALVNVQAKFILKKQSELAAEIVTEEYNAEPASADLQFNDSDRSDEWVRIGDKALRLTEAKLDNALREEGVSDAEIKGATREKRVDLFRESIARKTSRRAFGAAAGVIPVKSFEAVDCNGRASVSIMAVYSEKNREFVQAILGGESMKPDASRASAMPFELSVESEIDDGSIVYEWGIRKLYDSTGLPLLASYGQWGYVPQEGMAKANERRRRSALNQADAGALEQLTLFLDSQANFLNETSREEFSNSFVRVTQTTEGTTRTEEVVSEIVERSTEQFRARGSVRLTGLSDPIHWDRAYPHEQAQANVVGSVIYWSPRAEDAINRATGQRADRVLTEKPIAEQPQGEAQSAGSKVKNSADDF